MLGWRIGDVDLAPFVAFQLQDLQVVQEVIIAYTSIECRHMLSTEAMICGCVSKSCVSSCNSCRTGLLTPACVAATCFKQAVALFRVDAPSESLEFELQLSCSFTGTLP